MKMNEVRLKAKAHGINPVRKTKAGLIHEIQLAEGNFDCFGTADGFCDQTACCYRSICVGKQSAKVLKTRIRREYDEPIPTAG